MNVMIIDDDKECLECLSNGLRLNEFDVQVFMSPEAAIHSYDASSIDIVITDYHLPDTTGIDILNALKLKNTAAHVIIISGDPAENIEPLALQAGAFAFYKKPLNISTLIAKLNSIPPKKL